MAAASTGSSKLPGTHATWPGTLLNQCLDPPCELKAAMLNSKVLLGRAVSRAYRRSHATTVRSSMQAGSLADARTHSGRLSGCGCVQMTAAGEPLTSTSLRCPPWRSMPSRTPSSSGLVTSSLKRAATTPNFRPSALRLPTKVLACPALAAVPACRRRPRCCGGALLCLTGIPVCRPAYHRENLSSHVQLSLSLSRLDGQGCIPCC